VIVKLLQKTGAATLDFLEELGQVSTLLWKIITYLPRVFKNRVLVLKQMEHIGVDSIPLVTVISIFTGAVSAWQAAYQLKGLAPLSFMGGGTSRAIMTELAPVLTGIVIAGRIGASIAAEIGTMKVTEQIDALEVMGISPIRFLAMPRVLAAVLMMPFIVVFSNVIAIVGAYVVSNYSLGVSYAVFFQSVKHYFLMRDFVAGMIKGTFFGGFTSLLGCHIGFRTEGGAEGVGTATIRSFVISAALILILDYILWMFLF